MVSYRIDIDYTYNNGGNASTAESNINAYLSSVGRPETCTRNGSSIEVIISGLTQSEADTLRNGLISKWAVGTRNGGKASCVIEST